jgi:hypothetical protein
VLSDGKSRRISVILALLAGVGLLSGSPLLARQHASGQPSSTPQAPGQPNGSGGDHGQPSGSGGRPGRNPGQDVRPWWKDPAMAKEVGLTRDQIAKIDKLYDQRQAQIKPKVDEYNRQLDELNRLTRERTSKPSEIEDQARRLSYPRIDIDVSRAKMLYEMTLVLNTDQYNRMRAMFARMDQEREAMFKRYEQERARGRGGNLPQ